MASIKKASATNATDPVLGTYGYNDKPENWRNNVAANTPGKKNNSILPNVRDLIQAGIDPETKLPFKLGAIDAGFKQANKQLLSIIDEQDAINRYKWYNLPNGLTQHLIERVLYSRGQGMFFYMEQRDRFFFLPYALDGTIDVYGRFVEVTPLPFRGSAVTVDKKGKVIPWIKGERRKVVYDIFLDEPTPDDLKNSCVLLSDYCKHLSETNIARQDLNAPLLDVMADCIPFLRTALLAGTGVLGMRVNTQDEYSNVEAASRSLDRAALTGRKYVPILAPVEFQELAGGSISKTEEFLLAMQGLDNYRLSTYGIKNGGLFQKKAHMLQAEQEQAGISNSPMQDGLTLRQEFCNIVNSIWELGMWVEVSEPQLEADYDADGLASDTQDPEDGGGQSNDI